MTNSAKLLMQVLKGAAYLTDQSAAIRALDRSLEDEGVESPLPMGMTSIDTGVLSLSSDKASAFRVQPEGWLTAPSVILLDSNFRTAFSETVKPVNSTVVCATWFARGFKSVSTVPVSFRGGNASTANAIGVASGKMDGGIESVDGDGFSMNLKSNRRLSRSLVYRWYAIWLDADMEFNPDI